MRHLFVLCTLCVLCLGLPTSSVGSNLETNDGSLHRHSQPDAEVPTATQQSAQTLAPAAEQPAQPAQAAAPAAVEQVHASATEAAPAAAPEAAPAAATHLATLDAVMNTDSSCSGKKCKPAVSKACKGKPDLCRNETECCEIDKCNVWQHVGRDSAVLLVFYVSWCPVSRDFMLTYDLLRAKYEPFTNLLIAKVDADQNTNLVADFGIDEYPGLVFFRRDCYWSAGGCYDPMVWLRYNGTSNEFDEVDMWLSRQLLDEQNGNAYRQLPEEPEGRTGCKVSKLTRPPEDMREAFKFPADEGQPLLPPLQSLLQTEERVEGRPSCRINLDLAKQADE